MQPIDIEDSFTYHAPTPEQIVHYEALRAAGKQFAYAIVEHVPDGPRKTLALRELEMVLMLANKGIACPPPPPPPAPGPYLDGAFGDGVQPA